MSSSISMLKIKKNTHNTHTTLNACFISKADIRMTSSINMQGDTYSINAWKLKFKNKKFTIIIALAATNFSLSLKSNQI